MKKLIPFLFAVAASVFMISCNSGKNSDGYLLKMRLNKGDKFAQEINMNMDMNINAMGMSKDMKMKMDIGTDFEVMDSSSAGRDMKITYTKMNMKMNMGSPETEAMTDSLMNKNNNQIIGKSVVITLANNKVTDVKGFDELAGADSTDIAAQQAMKKMFSKESINSMFGIMFGMYPNKAVKEGESWNAENNVDINGMTMTVKTVYKLLRVKDGIAEISLDGSINTKGAMTTPNGSIDMDMKGSQKGKMNIKMADGYLQSGNYDMDIDANMEMMGQKMPMKMKAAYLIKGN